MSGEKNNNPSENMTFRLKCDKKFEIEKVKYSNCANTNIPIRIRKKYEFNLRLEIEEFQKKRKTKTKTNV